MKSTFLLMAALLSLPLLFIDNLAYATDKFDRSQANLPNITVSSGKIKNIYIDADQLTDFTRPNEIIDYGVSQDNNLLFVWHRDYPPLKLSIYDLNTRQRISQTVPGFGGSMAWTAANNLIHFAGCGTNCVNIAGYNRMGARQFEEIACGVELSPQNSYLLMIPSMPACEPGVKIVDLRTFKVSDLTDIADDVRFVFAVTWQNSRDVKIEFEDSSGMEQSKIFSVKK